MLDVSELSGLRFAAGLPPQTLAELAGLASIQTFAQKRVVFREGDRCPDIFLLQSGRVALDMHVSGRGPVRILTVGEGELLGWSALLGDGPMTATATTLEATRLVVIPGATLGALCEANHEVGYRMMQQMARAMAQRLVATRLQFLDLFSIDR
jgi:CRP-like cAMP-binding protein